jgi:hypothetical protein
LYACFVCYESYICYVCYDCYESYDCYGGYASFVTYISGADDAQIARRSRVDRAHTFRPGPQTDDSPCCMSACLHVCMSACLHVCMSADAASDVPDRAITRRTSMHHGYAARMLGTMGARDARTVQRISPRKYDTSKGNMINGMRTRSYYNGILAYWHTAFILYTGHASGHTLHASRNRHQAARIRHHASRITQARCANHARIMPKATLSARTCSTRYRVHCAWRIAHGAWCMVRDTH